MKIDVFTIFPHMFDSPLKEGMLRIAQEKGLVEIAVHDLRDFTHDRHRTVDDTPYGGGVGMVMKPEPFFEGVESLIESSGGPQALEELRRKARIILLSPQGIPLKQKMVKELAAESHLILLCGRYEGVDERVREHLANMEISIGDYVLSGGELPAMVVIDAISRSVLGVLGKELSLVEETFSQGLLEYPQYTRPPDYRGWTVPEVLLSGNHQVVDEWRRLESLERTLERRPDLLTEAELTEEDRKLLEKLKAQG
jgi:tRNA (guanine37-N1)-methyltransferase